MQFFADYVAEALRAVRHAQKVCVRIDALRQVVRQGSKRCVIQQGNIDSCIVGRQVVAQQCSDRSHWQGCKQVYSIFTMPLPCTTSLRSHRCTVHIVARKHTHAHMQLRVHHCDASHRCAHTPARKAKVCLERPLHLHAERENDREMYICRTHINIYTCIYTHTAYIYTLHTHADITMHGPQRTDVYINIFAKTLPKTTTQKNQKSYKKITRLMNQLTWTYVTAYNHLYNCHHKCNLSAR